MRWRFLIFAGCIVCWALRFYSAYPLNGDWWVFELGARVFAKVDGPYYAHYPGGALHLYATFPKLQVGPPALLLAVPAQLLPPRLSRELVAGLLAGAGLLVIWLGECIAARAGRSRTDVQSVSLGAGVALAPLWVALAVKWMHLDDAMVMILLEFALFSALGRGGLRRRTALMGIALGCAIATKPWAVSFLPLVLMLPKPGARRAGMMALGTSILWWLPFLLAAPTTASLLSDIGGPTQPRSLWWMLGFNVEPSGGRELQLAVATLACAFMVRRGRWWAAPVVATALRLALDWQVWLYYDASLLVCAAICDLGEKGRGRFPRVTACALMTSLVVPVGETISMRPAASATLRLILLLTTAGVAFGRRAGADPAGAAQALQPELGTVLARPDILAVRK